MKTESPDKMGGESATPRTDAVRKAMQGGCFAPDVTHPFYVLSAELERESAHHSAQLEKALGRIAELEAGLGQIAKLYSAWVPPDDAERFLNNQVARASDIARALLHPDSTKS